MACAVARIATTRDERSPPTSALKPKKSVALSVCCRHTALCTWRTGKDLHYRGSHPISPRAASRRIAFSGARQAAAVRARRHQLKLKSALDPAAVHACSKRAPNTIRWI